MRNRLLLASGLISLLLVGIHFLGSPAEIVTHHTHAASKPLWLARLTMDGRPIRIASAEPVRTGKPQRDSKQEPIKLLPVVDQKDIKMKHRILAHNVISLLPQKCIDTLKNFYVRYDNPEHRGLGGKSTVILDGGVPDAEFVALLVHELAHMIDLGCLTGTPSSGSTAYKDGRTVFYQDDPSVSYYAISWESSDVKRGNTRDQDFTSGYASWNMFEDFAETFAYFMLHREAFEVRAKENGAMAAKYRWMNHYFGHIHMGEGLHPWNGRVHWDTTKLAYEWITN